jgi:outer membrane protein insertion porin family
LKIRSSLRAPVDSTSHCPTNTPWRRRGVFIWLAAALLFAAPVFADPPPQSVNIAEIRVTGNQRASAEAVINTFGLETGQTYPYSEVKEGLERLYAIGMFDDLKLYIDTGAAGDMLTIEVVERPIVASLKIRGNKKISEKDIREKIGISVGSSLDPRLVHESLMAIKDLCEEKGYYFARATSTIEERTETSVLLIFEVDEGAKVKVGRIDIEGNEEISDGDIKGVMKTKTRKWLMSQDYKPDQFEADIGRIEELLKDRG